MRQAIVSVEDQRFYEHDGVDVRGIARALWQDVRQQGIVEGGSTITQQFVKNAYIRNERTLARKVREAALAWQLEQRWSKDRILTAYLNTIYFGHGAYGIQQAARAYFKKSARDLTLAESALLAGIPADPSLYDPAVNPRNATLRRRHVLAMMLDQGKITERQFARADRGAAPEADGGARARNARAVLRELRHRPARRPVRRRQGLRRRAEGDHHDRPRPAAEGARSDREDPSQPRRPGRGARGHRAAIGRSDGDVRRAQLPPEPVQPRGAGEAPARLGFQADRAGRRHERGDLSHYRARVEARLDRRRRSHLEGHELRQDVSRPA